MFAAALLTASLALAGCSAADNNASDAAGGRPAAGQPAQDGQKGAVSGAGAPAPGGTPGQTSKSAPAPSGVHVIRTASLSVRVKDTRKAVAFARSSAGEAGGFVENETTTRDPDKQVTSRVVLRVPQGAYDRVMDQLAGNGTLLARKADAKDVTGQVVDTDSRVKSQRASVDRVRKLMDQADSIADVVTLESELSTRQSALESLLAEQASLKDRTTLATITLNLSEPAPKAARQQAGTGPTFMGALGGGWHAFTGTLRWIAVVLGAVAPFLVGLGVLYALWRLGRSVHAARLAPGARTGTTPATDPDAPSALRAPASAGDGTREQD
ncbi:DUF4349 domain-containing protein [Streptomyces sp. NPDC088725]|uniref:DUF4349 domain-containing protein n=1 Tax=Streptomyces sp. NPDC088725 TaxID=3365873 RepID=UPI00381180F2